jgi:YbbR domain-containing protein
VKAQLVLSENASYKIVALLITLILWVIILGSKEDSLVKHISANYILPRGMVLTNQVPTSVDFRFTGPRLPLKRFSETIEPLTIDLSSQPEGPAPFRIHPDNIDVPPGIRVISVTPSSITANLEKMVSVKVPVEIKYKNTLAPGLRLVRATVDPMEYELLAPRSVAEKTKKISTDDIDLGLIKSSQTLDVDVIASEPVIKKETKTQVRVSLEIRAK